MSDELAAAEAVLALERLDVGALDYKSDLPSAVLHHENREVTTLFSVNNVDSQGDITPPEAFKMSIGLGVHRIPHLYMHDLHLPAVARVMAIEPVGRSELPADVQTAYPAADGGMVAVSRFLKSGRAQEIYEGICEGIGYQASFGYIIRKASAHPTLKAADGRPARLLEEVHLAEISTTPPGHAANDATRVRLGKAQALLEEYKAGRRHGRTDMQSLRQLALLLLDLGADNIMLIPDLAVQPDVAHTDEADRVLSSIADLFEVS